MPPARRPRPNTPPGTPTPTPHGRGEGGWGPSMPPPPPPATVSFLQLHRGKWERSLLATNRLWVSGKWAVWAQFPHLQNARSPSGPVQR